MRKISIIIVFLIGNLAAWSQLASEVVSPPSSFNKGKSFFQNAIYNKAIAEFEQFKSEINNEPYEDYSRYLMESDYYIALASIKLDRADAESKILKFINDYKPDPFAEKALIDVASFYFDQRKYDKAYSYFEKVNLRQVSPEQKAEVQFKKGYVHFDKKQYNRALKSFSSIQNVQGVYYLETNYYIALCQYYLGNYTKAISYFKKVESSRKYARFIPSYLTQIYYQQGMYDEIITSAPKYLKDKSTKEKDQIGYLLALSYIQNEDYEKALPLLEDYARSNKLSEEDAYQLAYARYKTGDCAGSIAYFQRVSDKQGELGQNANLYLADCFIKQGDRESARNAFANAARRSSNPEISEEASFNYGKLSAEMGFDREAVNALSEISQTSPYYKESQDILSDLFIKTRDYGKAIATIESMPSKGDKIKRTYQQLTYYRAIQNVQAGENQSALQNLNKSLENPKEKQFEVYATFLKADLLNREKNYRESIKSFDRFFQKYESLSSPILSYYYLAHYIQGYNYIKLENYKKAENYFSDMILDIKRNRVNIKNEYIEKNIYSDALLRKGDCHFKAKAYDEAIKAYDEAIKLRANGFQYALFQKGILLGLQKKNIEKITVLNDLVQSHPKSTYADDALYEMGKTYNEMGQLQNAIQPLRRLVNEYEKSSELIVDGLLRLGLIAYNLGDVKASLNYYKSVFDHNPDAEQTEEALLAIEEIYVEDLGDPNAFVEFKEQTSGIKVGANEKEQLSYKAAEAKYNNGDYEAAIDAYQNYILSFPEGAHVLASFYKKGESHLVLKQYSNALIAYENILEKGPSPYYVRAAEKAAVIAYNHEEDFDKATKYYQIWANVATNEEDRFDALLGGLQASYRSGQPEAVIGLANEVSENPTATPEHKALALFYKGKVSYDKQLYSQALDALNEVSKLSDNEQTAEARYLIAKIYYLENDMDLAETLARESYKESSAYPFWVAKSLILLSDVLVKKGDTFNAKAALEAVIENFNEDKEILKEANDKLATLKSQENE